MGADYGTPAGGGKRRPRTHRNRHRFFTVISNSSSVRKRLKYGKLARFEHREGNDASSNNDICDSIRRSDGGAGERAGDAEC
jgi:hypothetical protein